MSELKAFTFGLGQYTEDGSPCVVAFDGEKNPRLASDEKFYLKSEADKVIAELKDEIKRLENVRKVHIESIDSMCEGLKLNAKQICKTQRALWLARAERAKAIKWHEGLERYLQERKKWWPSRFCFMADDEMYHVWYKCWCEVERKCRAKAKELE